MKPNGLANLASRRIADMRADEEVCQGCVAIVPREEVIDGFCKVCTAWYEDGPDRDAERGWEDGFADDY